MKSLFAKLFWATICIIGCCYQLYTLIDYYFSYPTTTSVNIEFPSSYELPAITICGFVYGLIERLNGTTPKQAIDSSIPLQFKCTMMARDCKRYYNKTFLNNINYYYH